MVALLDISQIGLFSGIYYVSDYKFSRDDSVFILSLSMGDESKNWADKFLDYCPHLVIQEDVVYMAFRNEADALLFKMHYFHLWQDDE